MTPQVSGNLGVRLSKHGHPQQGASVYGPGETDGSAVRVVAADWRNPMLYARSGDGGRRARGTRGDSGGEARRRRARRAPATRRGPSAVDVEQAVTLRIDTLQEIRAFRKLLLVEIREKVWSHGDAALQLHLLAEAAGGAVDLEKLKLARAALVRGRRTTSLVRIALDPPSRRSQTCTAPGGMSPACLSCRARRPRGRGPSSSSPTPRRRTNRDGARGFPARRAP